MLDLVETGEKLKSAFLGSSDFIALDFNVGDVPAKAFFIDGMTDKILFEQNILRPLKQLGHLESPYLDALNSTTFMSNPILSEQIDEAIKLVAQGDVAILLDKAEEVFIFSLRQYPKRGIMEPPSSSVLKGPREGFTEDMKTNMILTRRRLRTPNLVFQNLMVGKYTGSAVSVVYLEGVAEEKIVSAVRKKIEAIDFDGALDSSYVGKYLEENHHSIFNQVGSVEKPDIFAAKLLEGRVGILVDGSPMALTVPFVFYENFQGGQDYYNRDFRASVLRLVRLIGMIAAILLPAFYVAVQEYQYQMLPFKFLTTVINAVDGIPLSPMTETLFILLVFEILNEASVRMPRYVGMALSIVGAIVLGDTAVKAGIISSPAVLITALSTIGLYCVPDSVGQASLLRFLFAALAGVLGVFGVVVCFVALIAYMAGLNSMGVPFLAPYAPMIVSDLQDGILKENMLDMKKRPFTIPTANRRRQK